MSWLSKGLSHAHLGGLNNLVRATHIEQATRPLGIDHLGTTVWDSVNNQWDMKKLKANAGDLAKYGAMAYGAVSGAEGLAGGSLFGGGAAAGGAGAGGAGALTEFTPEEIAGMGTTTTFPAAGAGGASASAPSSNKSSFIRAALNAAKGAGQQQQQPGFGTPQELNPPASTAALPPDRNLDRSNRQLGALEVRPQPQGGADIAR